MEYALTASFDWSRIGWLVSGIAMLLLGYGVIRDHRNIVTRINVRSVERGAAIRGMLRSRNDSRDYLESWFKRQMILARIWGAGVLLFGFLSVLRAIFGPG